MNYIDFNNRVIEFYTGRAKTSFCTFSLDHSEFEFLIGQSQIASFELLKNDWTCLVEGTADLPRYFGLIALQCFAATQMEDGDNVTDDAYIYRLQKLLGVSMDLQQFFKSPVGEDTIQEKIWYDAKRYLAERFGLKLEIPNRKSYKGKFVQYPLSQLLLKTEDFKDFTSFFAEYFLPKENIPFHFFRDKLIEWLPDKVSVRIGKLMEEPTRFERCSQQLFNYFQSWSGDVHQKHQQSNKSTKNIYKSEEDQSGKLILTIDEGKYHFYFQKELIKPDKVFNIKSCHYFYRGLILFNPELDYDNEFEQSRFLCLGAVVYLLVDRRFKAWEYDFLQRHASATYPIATEQALFRFSLYSIGKTHPLKTYFYRVNPISLLGGIKLNRSNLFLVGFGPLIDYQEEFKVLYKNRPVEYHPQTALLGDYKVRVAEYHDIPFSIIDVNPCPQVNALFKGWDLHSINLTEKPMLEGCRIYQTNHTEQTPIRAWINTNLGKPLNKASRSRNSILTTLEYAIRKTCKR